ncbi:hypothetical protein BJY00DRAFT_281463 [Aspergillus carlsbadensis]|nr:hypothetical protein BJY00DRAFT_281463 [Aspergillus carlsbadensis]
MGLLRRDIIPGYFNSGQTTSKHGKFRQYCRPPWSPRNSCHAHHVNLVSSCSSQDIDLILCSSFSLRSSFWSLLSCLLYCSLRFALNRSPNCPLLFGRNDVRLDAHPDQRFSTSGQRIMPTARYIMLSTGTLALWLCVDIIPTVRAINCTNLGHHLLSPRLQPFQLLAPDVPCEPCVPRAVKSHAVKCQMVAQPRNVVGMNALLLIS